MSYQALFALNGVKTKSGTTPVAAHRNLSAIWSDNNKIDVNKYIPHSCGPLTGLASPAQLIWSPAKSSLSVTWGRNQHKEIDCKGNHAICKYRSEGKPPLKTRGGRVSHIQQEAASRRSTVWYQVSLNAIALPSG
jgi:hypothetical protein